MLVKFEGVRDVACFKENKISCTKLYHIACITTNPNSKRAAIELGTRANTSKGNSGMKATKVLRNLRMVGWFIIPGQGI